MLVQVPYCHFGAPCSCSLPPSASGSAKTAAKISALTVTHFISSFQL